MASREPDPALARLAGRLAGIGRLDAVVERVPDEVAERIADLLEDRSVELGVLALDDEGDVLEIGRASCRERVYVLV